MDAKADSKSRSLKQIDGVRNCPDCGGQGGWPDFDDIDYGNGYPVYIGQSFDVCGRCEGRGVLIAKAVKS